jgi:exodeoxyribonuclease VII small subunit
MNRRPPTEPEPQSQPASAGPSFEAAIKRLTEIVQTLERGELPLEESLRLFEEGVKLSRVSQQRLDAAEKRVEQLLAVDEQGHARTTPFATEASRPADEDDEGPPF